MREDALEVAPGLFVIADGAAWIPAAATLVVADVHVGYARAARRRGGWLPGSAETPEALAGRLRVAAARTGATRLVIAGDLRHSTRDVDDAERAEVARLLATLREGLQVEVVAGNHDRGDATLLPETHAGDVHIVHAPPPAPPARWTVCGHLHPSLTLRDEIGAALRVPCALVGPRVVILPAFTTWAGGTEARRLVRQMGWGEWRVVATAGGRAWLA